jgi:hypothetical protein
MDLGNEQERAAWKADLAGMFRDRKVVTGLLPLAALTPWVRLLKQAGAQRPLVLGTGVGVGEVPTADDADIVVLQQPRYPSMTEELRRSDRFARHLPTEASVALARYDPDREAVWWHGPFVLDEPIDGRPVLGGRSASWLALEDKLLAEGIWAAVGAPHAAATVLPVHARTLREASAALDEGDGVVWAGDARDGFNGGGDFTRWVGTTEDRATALAFFAPRCDRVRVMPFLEGVPCSIHGIVLPDGTAAFRPVELAILRGPERRFVYGGQGTTWDPPTDDRHAMRELVRRTGEHLRDRVGYRGGFGIDGVLTHAGFRPTELNTRVAGGLSSQTQVLDGDAFTLLQLACLAGRDPCVTVAGLEDWAVPALDAHRFTKALGMSSRRVVEESVDLPVVWDGATLRRATTGEAAATVQVGPSAVGAFCRLKDDVLAPGERLGPLNAAMLRFLDAELDTGFGPVEAAPDVRSGPTA